MTMNLNIKESGLKSEIDYELGIISNTPLLIMVNIAVRKLPVPSKTASVMKSRVDLVFVYIVLLTGCNLLVV